MKFTFGIITSGHSDKLIESIRTIKQTCPCDKHEVIVVGGNDIQIQGVNHIQFDETIKNGWISKKKNIITQNANYDNIVYMHDYYSLDVNWYDGFVEFGDSWDICMNMILNIDNTRFRDWCIWDDPKYCFTTHGHRAFLAPYSYDKCEYMYISGGYWVAKKHVMLEEPINEDFCWGQGEDVEWSKRTLNKYKYKINLLSATKLLKSKETILERLPNE